MARHWIVFQGVELFTPKGFNSLTHLTGPSNFLEGFPKNFGLTLPQEGSLENLPGLSGPWMSEIVYLLEELGQ